MQRVLIVMAMHAEAEPVAAALGLRDGVPLHESLTGRVRRGEFAGASVFLVVNGVDQVHGVDAIGTVPAALTAWEAATQFSPTLIVSAGTAGGFARRGAAIGDVFLSQGPLVFHDRRIRLGGFEAYGRGAFACVDASRVAPALGLKMARFTTGDSLDLSAADAAEIEASGAGVKDMESAAVAWVAQMRGVPFMGVRAITDIVDGPHPTGEEFMRNLGRAVSRLAEELPRVFARMLEEDFSQRR